jgi:UDP-N-acetylglucosamine 2-epimerase (non-hydrolysing)
MYYFFVGTIAEFIKVFPVMLEMDTRGIKYKIIATNQNLVEYSDVFQSVLHKKIFLTLSNGKIKKSSIGLLFWFVKTFFVSLFMFYKAFSKDNKGKKYLIIHGDTVSTLMGAILGKIFRFTVCHIESGLRSFNFLEPFPEEIDRVLASRFVNIHFCPNDWAMYNLKHLSGEKINTTQNTLLDSLRYALSQKIDSELIKHIEGNEYAIFVCHRQENLSKRDLLESLVGAILEQSQQKICIFILHEITKIALEKFDLLKKIQDQNNIILVDRLPYFELMHIMQKADFIITDGGSNQEESYYLGLPALILRNYSERKEGLGQNAILYKGDNDLIREFCSTYKKYKTQKVVDRKTENPSKIIVDYLIKT